MENMGKPSGNPGNMIHNAGDVLMKLGATLYISNSAEAVSFYQEAFG